MIYLGVFIDIFSFARRKVNCVRFFIDSLTTHYANVVMRGLANGARSVITHERLFFFLDW